MPRKNLIFYEVFGVWGIDFMGPLSNSTGYCYILIASDYVFRWVEAKATKLNDAKTVANFLKTNILCRFGSHFCNRIITGLL